MEFREFRKVVVVVVAAEGRGEVDEKQRGEAQKGGRESPGADMTAGSTTWLHSHLGRPKKYECLCPTSRDSDVISF